MSLIVQKFGGSSLADPDHIKNVAKRIIERKDGGHRVLAVVSAMGDSTDHLIELAQQITTTPSTREMDMLLSTGEQVSIALLAMAIQSHGYSVVSLTGPQAGIKTDAVHGRAKILDIETSRLKAELAKDNIIIVAGFQGLSPGNNEITTLGRGGSDTTAVALAAALEADICEIYTDVDGIYTSDPRTVTNAAKLACISYDEMLELASLGALVLQPRAVEFAKLTGVKLHVRSSFNHVEGTIVQEVGNMEKAMVVSGVACDKNVTKVAIFDVPDQPGIAYQLFSGLANENINVDMIIQSHEQENRNDISFTVTRDDKIRGVEIAKNIAQAIGAKGVAFDDTVAKVSIVGAGMKTNPGVAAKMFQVFYDLGINIQMISTSEIKVSCVIDGEHANRAVVALHQAFDLDKIK